MEFRRRWIIFFLFGASFAQSAAAEFSGQYFLEGSRFATKPPVPVTAGEGAARLNLNAGWKWGSNFRLKIQPWGRVSSEGGWGEWNPSGDAGESFVELKSGAIKIAAGSFVPKWEGTDGVNPMDIATMKDFRDPLRPDDLGSNGVKLSMAGESLSGEILYVPLQTRSRIPGYLSPWWPRRGQLPLQSETLELRLPERVDYRLLSHEEIDKALWNNAGLRLQYRGDGWDFSAAGFEGAAEMPTLRVSTVSLTPIALYPKEIYALNSVELLPIDYRRRTGAGAVTIASGTWIFRLAARHDQPLGDDSRRPQWSQQTVFGVEKNIELSEQNLILVLQGTNGRRGDDGSLTTVADLFDRAVLFGGRWMIGERWSVNLSAVRDLKKKSSYDHFEISRRFAESYSVEVFADVLDGPEDSLLGLLGDRDRGGLRVSGAF